MKDTLLALAGLAILAMLCYGFHQSCGAEKASSKECSEFLDKLSD